MPKRTSSSSSRKQPIDYRLVVAISLQEASTYLRQAELALEKLNDHDPSEVLFIRQVQRNLLRLHNRYSRVKMS